VTGEAKPLIGVVGAGTMGGGIAQVAAMAGYQVQVQDVSAEILNRFRQRLEEHLAGDARKECLRSWSGERDSGSQHVRPDDWIPVRPTSLKRAELVEIATGIGAEQPAPAEQLHLNAENPRVRAGSPSQPSPQLPEPGRRQVAVNNDKAVDIAARGIKGALGEGTVEVNPDKIRAQDLAERVRERPQGVSNGSRNGAHSCRYRL